MGEKKRSKMGRPPLGKATIQIRIDSRIHKWITKNKCKTETFDSYLAKIFGILMEKKSGSTSRSGSGKVGWPNQNDNEGLQGGEGGISNKFKNNLGLTGGLPGEFEKPDGSYICNDHGDSAPHETFGARGIPEAVCSEAEGSKPFDDAGKNLEIIGPDGNGDFIVRRHGRDKWNDPFNLDK
jgi:hypothetical protein